MSENVDVFIRVILAMGGGAMFIVLIKEVFSYLANLKINRETAVTMRATAADNSVQNALNTLDATVSRLQADNAEMRQRMATMEAERDRERAEWQRQMKELRDSLSTAQAGIAERDKEIKALTETVAKLQAELTRAQRGTGLNYTQRRK